MKPNTILQGDALELIQQVEDNSIDLIWFSPPYWDLHKYTNSEKEIGYGQTLEEYMNSLITIAKEGKRVLKDTGNFVINIMDLVRDNKPVRLSDMCIEKFPLIFIERIIWFIRNKTPVPSKKDLLINLNGFYILAKLLIITLTKTMLEKNKLFGHLKINANGNIIQKENVLVIYGKFQHIRFREPQSTI